MSTPEPSVLPAELRLGSQAPADLPPGPVPPASSPGVGLAATRVPSAPTLPDADTGSLTLAIARLANELFSGGGLPEAHDAGATPARATGAPSPDAVASPVADGDGPDEGPFFRALDLSAVTRFANDPLANVEILSFPLLDPEPRDGFGRGELRREDAGRTPPPVHSPASPFEFAEVVPDSNRPASRGFDAAGVRREFPILEERIQGHRLVWLDNAATTQKPRAVIDRIRFFYEHENSNVHRGAHTLAARATDAYEKARATVARFVGASSGSDVVFVRGATEGINLVAQSWGRRHVGEGDEILVTHLEHHANIVPWQMLCAATGARLRVVPVDDRGQVRLEEYEKLLNDRTKLVAFPHVSNALGTVTPVREMTAMARRRGARVLLDAAQSVSHTRVDVQGFGCDFLVFSGHKVFGPTGIGALVASSALLDDLPPWQGGGNMIRDVTFERTVYQDAPARFEAGTGSIADAVGLGAALEWLERIGLENVEHHESLLLARATERLGEVRGLRIVGTAQHKAGVLSFVLDGHDPREVSRRLDSEGIAVRAGHHCAQPILRRFGLESTVRASLALYNTDEDIDALASALERHFGGRGPSFGADSR